jgi:hypothetical protein
VGAAGLCERAGRRRRGNLIRAFESSRWGCRNGGGGSSTGEGEGVRFDSVAASRARSLAASS